MIARSVFSATNCWSNNTIQSTSSFAEESAVCFSQWSILSGSCFINAFPWLKAVGWASSCKTVSPTQSLDSSCYPASAYVSPRGRIDVCLSMCGLAASVCLCLFEFVSVCFCSPMLISLSPLRFVCVCLPAFYSHPTSCLSTVIRIIMSGAIYCLKHCFNVTVFVLLKSVSSASAANNKHLRVTGPPAAYFGESMCHVRPCV